MVIPITEGIAHYEGKKSIKKNVEISPFQDISFHSWNAMNEIDKIKF